MPTYMIEFWDSESCEKIYFSGSECDWKEMFNMALCLALEKNKKLIDKNMDKRICGWIPRYLYEIQEDIIDELKILGYEKIIPKSSLDFDTHLLSPSADILQNVGFLNSESIERINEYNSCLRAFFKR